MSNLIKGYSTRNSSPFIIDADKNEIAVQINERRMQEYEQQVKNSTEDGFVSGLSATELTPEELQQLQDAQAEQMDEMEQNADRVEDSELAHEAALVIEEAYQEAAEIRAQAQAQVEDIKAQGQLAGREEGYQQGMMDAAEEVEQLKEQLRQEQEQWKRSMQEEQEQALQELEPQFVSVLCDLLTRLTGVVVTGHKDVILYLINNAMRGIENSHSFIISLSEADFEYVSRHKEEIYGYLNPGVKIELFQDAKLTKNQCKIETDGGLVDLSLDVQVSQLIKSLMLLNA